MSKSNPRIVLTPLVLEAAGTVLTRLDSRSISAEAVFWSEATRAPRPVHRAIAASGGTFRRKLNGYSVTLLEADAKEQGLQALGRGATRPRRRPTGRSSAGLPPRLRPGEDQSWCELAGFEVVGASRQWGHTAAATPAIGKRFGNQAATSVRPTSCPDSLRKEEGWWALSTPPSPTVDRSADAAEDAHRRSSRSTYCWSIGTKFGWKAS